MTSARHLLARWEVGLVALILVIIVVAQLDGGELMGSYNLETTALNNVVLLCLAFGAAPVIMTGDIDISIVGTLSLTAAFTADLWQHGTEIWVAAALGVVVSVVCGLVNGLIVVLLDLPSLAVTLGTMGAYTGVSFLILGGNAITDFPSSLVTFGSANISGTPIPISVVVLAGFGAVLTYVVHGTKFGRSLFAIGGSRRAALYSGIAVDQVRITAFAISGLFAGLAAVFYLGNYDTAQGGIASDQLLPAITAVILGGVSAYGGSGTIPGVAIAAVLLALLQSALGLHGLSGEGQTIAVGVLLIVAIGGGSLLRSVTARRQRWAAGSRPPPAMAMADGVDIGATRRG
jgi:rhamnose transport system permease protein